MIQTLVLLVVLGFAFWLIERFVPIAEPFKTIIRVVIVLIFVIALFRYAGIY